MIDLLERRRLLAAVSIVNHKLEIVGTDGPDRIEMALSGQTEARVYDNGALALTFVLADAPVLSFAGLGGNDVLIMGRVPMRAYAEGGTGDDALSGSQFARNDTFVGGDGDDYLFGGPGDDFLQGLAGDDGLLGYDGNDTLRILSDSFGDDTVSGGDGIDGVDATDYTRGVSLVIGDRTPPVLTVDDFVFEDVEKVLATGFNDNISTVAGRPIYVNLGAGDDTFTGGRGDDTIFGEAGQDGIFGAGGNDLFYDQDGTVDLLNGGSGDDSAFVDSIDTVIDLENVSFIAPT